MTPGQAEERELNNSPAANRWWEQEIVLYLAGYIAEELAGFPPLQYEMGEAPGDHHFIGQDVPSEYFDLDQAGVMCLPDRYMDRAKVILADWWPAVEALAAALLEHKTLSARRARAIVKAERERDIAPAADA